MAITSGKNPLSQVNHIQKILTGTTTKEKNFLKNGAHSLLQFHNISVNSVLKLSDTTLLIRDQDKTLRYMAKIVNSSNASTTS